MKTVGDILVVFAVNQWRIILQTGDSGRPVPGLRWAGITGAELSLPAAVKHETWNCYNDDDSDDYNDDDDHRAVTGTELSLSSAVKHETVNQGG